MILHRFPEEPPPPGKGLKAILSKILKALGLKK